MAVEARGSLYTRVVRDALDQAPAKKEGWS